ncbi:transcriptional regulator [Halomarina pelagica]|uniref:transcriptional regulator n=1 Tax=Halomarina pelagica TaxID=2961599 RepID=UPI0020C5286A|nr:transcriptional regulator [Halomarina sp. BND7]
MSDPAQRRREKSTANMRAEEIMSELNRETDREILDILVTNAPLRVMDIAKIADRHPITVDQTCARLHEQGHISPLGRGLYDVTDDGIRHLENIDGT